jgi:hypothetical protein
LFQSRAVSLRAARARPVCAQLGIGLLSRRGLAHRLFFSAR